MTVLTPYWKECIKYPNIFYKWFNIFIILNSFGVLTYFIKLTKFILRLVIGSLVTMLGVLWSESLTSIPFLNSFALLIKDLLENISDIKIPTLSKEEILSNTQTTSIISV
jgi:hypothetical protein